MLLTPLVHDAISWLVLVTTYSLVGIVAACAGLARGHWFLRMAAVLLFLSLWLAAPESWFWATFALQSAIVIVVLMLCRSLKPGETAVEARSAKPPRGRLKLTFTLADLLLLTPIVGIVLAILTRAQFSEYLGWRATFVPGIFFALFTLGGALPIMHLPKGGKVWGGLLCFAIVFPAFLIGAWLLFARSARSRSARSMAAVSLLLIAAPPTVFYGWLIAPRFFSLPTRLENNGIDDVLQAAQRISNPAVDVSSLSDDELAALLAQHSEALDLARAGLARPCQMLLPREDWYLRADDGAPVGHGSLIQLGAELAAAGRLQRLKGHPGEAAECYFEAIRLGEVLMHGGTSGDAVIGTVIQRTALEGLQRLAPRLAAADCRKLAARLAEFDGRQETADQILARETAFFAKTAPWMRRWDSLRFDEFAAQARPSFIRCHNFALARLRLFRCHLALREYWLTHDEYPEKLANLVPQYLANLPPDPFNAGVLIYRRLPIGYLLYSIGPDGVDDGGRPLPQGPRETLADGDIVLDVALSPENESARRKGAHQSRPIERNPAPVEIPQSRTRFAPRVRISLR